MNFKKNSTRKLVVCFSILCMFLAKLLHGQTEQRAVDPLIAKFLNPTTYPGMMIAAHRGFWYKAPENSIESIKEAIRMGADMAEVDINHTSDGILILMHDSALERTTTIEEHPEYESIKNRFRPGTTKPAGEALVNNVSWDELNLINPEDNNHYVKLKDRHGNTYYSDSSDPKSYETVPKVSNVFSATKGKILLNLDKADRYLETIWRQIKEYEIQDQVITKGYLSIWELKQKYDSDFLSEIMSQHIYTPIANDKVPYDHLPKEETSYARGTLDEIENSIGSFMNDFLNNDEYGNHAPWADAFEPNPESFNSPIKSLIKTIAIPENKRVGTFSAYADLGEGHAINKGRWKFDPPFELRNNWDLCMKNGIDYIITDRIKFLQEYKTSIERTRVTPSTFLNLAEITTESIDDKGPTLIATHRAGNGSLGTENSLYAINQCINSGIDIIEIDIFRSSDGVYYVFHDRSLAKVTNVKSLFENRFIQYTNQSVPTLHYASSKYSSQEINQLKLRGRKNGKPSGYTQHKIPTLKEVLKLCKGKIIIRLDKWDDSRDRKNNVAELLDLIATENMFDQVIFGGTHTTLQLNNIFGDRVDEIYYSPVVNSGSTIEGINTYLTGNYNIPFFRIRLGSEGTADAEFPSIEPLIDYLRNTKGKWIYNSLVLKGKASQSGKAKDEADGWLDVIDKGINIIETDSPLRLKKWLKDNDYCTSDYGQINCSQ